MRLSLDGAVVLDPFVRGGTYLVETKIQKSSALRGGVSQDIFRQGLLPEPVAELYLDSVAHAERVLGLRSA